MKEIDFVKAVASGNDFILIDRFGPNDSIFGVQPSKLARQLCQRRVSVGADGLLLIEPSRKVDFKMRIFNPDGTEVDMCGNGLRCAALYACQKNITSCNKMTIQTRAGDLNAEVNRDRVRVAVSAPKDLRLKFNLDIDGNIQNTNFINTGVPHVVCFVTDLDYLNINQIGKAIRYHPEFQPGGTNVNFVEVLDKDHIKIRTYERGVEQETLACGTGSVAAAIVTICQMKEPQKGQYKIKVQTRGGEILAVYFNIDRGIINKVFLEGRVKIVYKGKIKNIERRKDV